MTRTLFIPARSALGAERIAYAIDDGRLACTVDYLSPAEATSRATALNFTGDDHAPYAVSRVASSDGWVRVARLLDHAGEIAAALALFVLAPAVMAAGWGLWS